MTDTTTDRADGLRAWGAGMYTTSAAAELLIHYGPPLLTGPWVGYDPDRDRYWFNTDAVEDYAGHLSGGQRRALDIAASIASDRHPVRLGDAASGLDREHIRLVLAAVAHAAGSHEHSEVVWVDDPAADGGTRPGGFQKLASLYPWPDTATGGL